MKNIRICSRMDTAHIRKKGEKMGPYSDYAHAVLTAEDMENICNIAGPVMSSDKRHVKQFIRFKYGYVRDDDIEVREIILRRHEVNAVSFYYGIPIAVIRDIISKVKRDGSELFYPHKWYTAKEASDKMTVNRELLENTLNEYADVEVITLGSRRKLIRGDNLERVYRESLRVHSKRFASDIMRYEAEYMLDKLRHKFDISSFSIDGKQVEIEDKSPKELKNVLRDLEGIVEKLNLSIVVEDIPGYLELPEDKRKKVEEYVEAVAKSSENIKGKKVYYVKNLAKVEEFVKKIA